MTNKLGFTQKMNRLNVVITQVRDDMIMITDIIINESQCCWSIALWIKKLISHFKQTGLIQKFEKLLKNIYVSETAELNVEIVQKVTSMNSNDVQEIASTEFSNDVLIND